MRLRSLLYVPADNDRFIARAHERGADAVILDLEDAVKPEAKDKARAGLGDAVAQVGQAGARVFVRINGDLDTARLDAEAAHRAGAFGLYVAKADAAKLDALDAFLTEIGGEHDPLCFVPLIEDPAGLLNAAGIARQKRVIALTAGGEDIAAALGAEPDAETLKLPKLLIHYAAKAHGLLSFGLFRSTAAYGDLDALEAAAREARRHGFDGASCVHPSAVEILNRAFAPSAGEIAWAKRVLAAADTAAGGAFALDGQMIDAPVIQRARAILEQGGEA
ncbi:HpcH/HpaI aldolase/citrate lyase family protein [Pelagibacterium xiamenense]|uniref:HpcH/HpaI aldolase/citrate lyase family protein n=1 Tax=Pelagibacterium xiamenense TaxID=2901140 RepID=UPI001E34D808|nr:aldolase/citrate lyase family protein [Pelagibacterium xiamenense]MCD7058938.1 aldolase/citrate lyase family protein [Pelagibacterium xiamenense]